MRMAWGFDNVLFLLFFFLGGGGGGLENEIAAWNIKGVKQTAIDVLFLLTLQSSAESECPLSEITIAFFLFLD